MTKITKAAQALRKTISSIPINDMEDYELDLYFAVLDYLDAVKEEEKGVEEESA